MHKMALFSNLVLLHMVLLSVVEGAKPVFPQKCTSPDLKIDWQRSSVDFNNFLPYPGVILSGDANVTFSEVLDFVGLLWNAKSPAEITGLFCTYYGPYVDALNPDDSTLRNVCNEVVTSLTRSKEIDFSDECGNVFKMFQEQLSSQITNQAQYICDDDFDFNNYFSSDPFYNFSNYKGSAGQGSSQYSFPFYQVQVQQSSPYLVCESYKLLESNILFVFESFSRVAFSVLDWLGPSPFSGDFYGACSALRFASSMRIDNITDNLKLIVKIAVAEGLKFFNLLGGCDLTDEQIQQTIDSALFLNQQGLCAFLQSNPSQDDYNRKADEIIDTVLSILDDDGQCINVLTLLAENPSVDSVYYFEQITGFNISMAERRQRFCSQVTDSLSSRSQYTPSTYVFPRTEDITYWYIDEPGELLPSFYFTDAVDVLGAFVTSETVRGGVNVLCTVFEPFLTEYEVQKDGESKIGELCSAFQNSDYDAIERLCREESAPYYYTLPLVRDPTLPYVIVIGVDALRQLFDVEALSPQSVCEAFNTFLNSDNNLQTVTRLLMRSYVAELLPIANDYCVEYDNVLRVFRDYETDEIFTDVVALVITHLGFSDRNSMCRSVADGIDDKSGRSTDDSTSFFLTQLLQFLKDTKRCTKTINSLKLLLTNSNQGRDVDPYFKAITGYSTTEELCFAVVSSFADKCSDASVLRLCSPVVMLTMLLATIALRN